MDKLRVVRGAAKEFIATSEERDGSGCVFFVLWWTLSTKVWADAQCGVPLIGPNFGWGVAHLGGSPMGDVDLGRH